MKKLFLNLFICILVLVGVGVCLYACNAPSLNTKNIGVYDNMYMEAVSGVNYLSEINKAKNPVRRLSKSLSEDFDVKSLISKVNTYTDNSFSALEKTSDKEEFDTLVEITTINKTYKMYYNKASVAETTSIDDEETETKKTFSGIIYNEDLNYNFKALVKEEIEDKDETELKFDMIIYLDDALKDYIKIEQEKEIENSETEEKFKYIEKINGSKKVLFEIEISHENDEYEIELLENGIKYELEFYTKKGIEYVLVKVDDRESTYKIEVLEDGTTNYIMVK